MGTIGEFAKTQGMVIISRVTDATGVTKGNVVSFDTNGKIQKATNTHAGPFGVALETIGASKRCRIAIGGFVYVTADGAIKPNKWVIIGTTDGQVITSTKQTISATYSQSEIQAVQNENLRQVGVYIDHDNELDDPTDAVDGDVIAIWLGRGF